MRHVTSIAILLTLCQTASGLQTVSRARTPSATIVNAGRDVEKMLIDCVEKVTPSFVFIGGGSGVCISADGLMLTNHHVARSSKKWQVRLAGERNFRNAKVLGFDPVGDVSLLKIECDEPLPFAEMGVSDELEVGTYVVAVGNPFLLADFAGEPTVSFGIVSAVKSYQESYFDAIWTDAAVNPGNSGGPLLTLDGKLVGINGRIETRFMTRSNTGIGYAISIDQIKRFLPGLKVAKCGAVMHAQVRGLALEVPDRDDSSPAEYQNRVLTSPVVVKEAKDGTTAAAAGFKAGDRIVAIDDYATFNRARYNSVLGAYPAGHEVTFLVKRPMAMPSTREKDVTIEVKLDSQSNIGLGCRLAMGRAPLPGKGPTTCLMVIQVPKGGRAEKAGLKRGDCITAINGQKFETPQVVRKIFAELTERHTVGDEVRLDIFRPRARKELKIKLELSPAYQ
jgi:S1-C subfamily serine protease